MLRAFFLALSMAIMTAFIGSAPATAGDFGYGGRYDPYDYLWDWSCQELWVERNSIYARRGYCFRTRRAIRYFSNDGCWTRRPRLSRSEQRLVDAIRRVEIAKGCR